MDYLNKYRNRMGYSGENVGEALTSHNNAFIESTFQDSPTYRLAEAMSYENPDIQYVDTRVIRIERLGNIKEVLFRPSFQGLGIGSYLKFDGDIWLIYDKYTDSKVLVQRCNEALMLKDKQGNIIRKPCVASASDLGSKAKQGRNELEWNKYDVTLPLGQLFIFIELTDETKDIKINQRFVLGTKVYEVIGYDDVTAVETVSFSEDNKIISRHGMLQLNLKVTTGRDGEVDSGSPDDSEGDGGWDW